MKHRRYTQGKHFYYDLKFEAEARLSWALNEDIQSWGLGVCKDRLQEKEEQLKQNEDNLRQFNEEWEFTKQIRFNQGQSTKENVKTRERRHTLEALIDIVKIEIERLTAVVAELEAEAKKRNETPCLGHGPRGHSHINGYTGKGHVDGQHVKPVNGRPVIIDERSPYYGMAVRDYLEKVSKPWGRACSKRTNQMRDKLLREGKQKEIQRRYSVPWPKWPKGVKRHVKTK